MAHRQASLAAYAATEHYGGNAWHCFSSSKPPSTQNMQATGVQANQLQDTCKAQALDWTAPLADVPCQPDLLLASDLLYERAAVPALFGTIHALSHPDTVTLLAVEVRPAIHGYAMGQLKSSGLHARQVRTHVLCTYYSTGASGFAMQVPATEMHEDWQSPDIQIYELRLQAAERNQPSAA